MRLHTHGPCFKMQLKSCKSLIGYINYTNQLVIGSNVTTGYFCTELDINGTKRNDLCLNVKGNYNMYMFFVGNKLLNLYRNNKNLT